MNKSKPRLFPNRLSLVYSGPGSKSPKLCLMFVEALAVRMTQGLDWEAEKQNYDFHKITVSKEILQKQRTIAMASLVDVIHSAFVFTESYLPAKLEREAWEEVDKLPESLLSHCEERKIPSTKIVELNGLADVPRLINYNEEYMEGKIRVFRYRLSSWKWLIDTWNFSKFLSPTDRSVANLTR
ncbi:hypothetical protein V8E51_013863 [Hyaloscypha variabilis]